MIASAPSPGISWPLLLLLAQAAFFSGLQGALLVHETFPYPDGPLVQVAPDAWSHYSGTSNQLRVAGGRALLSETSSEDVQVFLPGRPYTNGVLYVRFLVNFSRLPSGGGGCFALLKDAGVNNNRACLYATTMDAPAGHYRLGLRLTGVTSPLYASYHPQACPTQAAQVVILRYQLNPPAAALWLNPVSEQDPALEMPADGTASLAIHAFALRQSLASGNGMGELALDSLRIGSSFAEVATPGAPPTLSAFPDLDLPAGGVSPPLLITLTDEDTPLPFIYLYAQCEPPHLIPPEGFLFQGAGGERTLVVRAADGQQGVARVLVTALDDTGLSAQRAFTVRLGAPSCAPLADQIISVNQTLNDLPLHLQDAEQDVLTLTITSSDRTLFPATNIVVAGEGYERRLTLRPAPDRAGHAFLSLLLSDGHHRITNQFQVTVAPRPGRLVSEEFDYPDGALIAVGPALWQSHSGEAGQAWVENGSLHLCETNSEDVSVTLGPPGITAGSGYVLYARVDFRVLRLPTNAVPAYWAHYKDGGTGYRCRLFISTNQAPPGHFRLGLSSAAALPTAETTPLLRTQTLYTVVTRFNVNNGQCLLWLDPTCESDAALVAGDTTGSSTVAAWAFRQAANIGALSIERLRVGTAFADVLPAPARLYFAREEAHLVLRWPEESGAVLETSARLSPDAWEAVSAPGSSLQGWRCWTNILPGDTRFFRLRQ
ncbi:MAG: hypothetical protein N3J91_05985 [Verrucomicrobiae bacterium]|nr:hypothetical protein [Verrucomicrobiae bacterium]